MAKPGEIVVRFDEDQIVPFLKALDGMAERLDRLERLVLEHECRLDAADETDRLDTINADLWS